ncbi:MAG: Phosphoserine phosphatase [Candidatus Roizmanbacteria bacterium GW2011_GWA2_36_23]|uniref:phosphoserine phosphatase n=1 Tax=Candidatus Roizmanbacteria bacterium GW2011_GWA2_36_23 TaxID=1618480 RepID=A0A0G0EKA8_9BACT|nr:MAG: Phosphoserine phosphatase [Candidatus Roizmanbacteria bacterium GW2011_GWA2_36_23]
MIKAVLSDFDGTIVTKDILDVVCGIVGKDKESQAINQQFHSGESIGLNALKTRINFLKGVDTDQIQKKINENYCLMPGASELFDFLNSKGIVSVLHSGNIIPILKTYQNILGITHIVGTQPQMNGGIIQGISDDAFPSVNFKLHGVKKILDSLSIKAEETIAIGDSPADKAVFDFARYSIAINPKGGIEKSATYTIKDDLAKAIPIIEGL